jgi:hypothetical protein
VECPLFLPNVGWVLNPRVKVVDAEFATEDAENTETMKPQINGRVED